MQSKPEAPHISPEDIEVLCRQLRARNAPVRRREAVVYTPKKPSTFRCRAPLKNLQLVPAPQGFVRDGSVQIGEVASALQQDPQLMSTLSKMCPQIGQFVSSAPKTLNVPTPRVAPVSPPCSMKATKSLLPPVPDPPGGGIDWLGQLSDWFGGGWISTLTTFGISAGVSFGLTLLESLIAHVFEGYPTVIKIVTGVMYAIAALVGAILLAFALYAVVLSGGAGILALFLAVLVGIIGTYIGRWLAKHFVKFLAWAIPDSWKEVIQLKTYDSDFVDPDAAVEVETDNLPPDDVPPVYIAPVILQAESTEESEDEVILEAPPPHVCGEDPGYLHLGKCHFCYRNPANVGFVHKNKDQACMFCCHDCYKGNLIPTMERCLCKAELLSDNRGFVDFVITDVARLPCRKCVWVDICPHCDEADPPRQTTREVFSLQGREGRPCTCVEHKPPNTASKTYGIISPSGYRRPLPPDLEVNEQLDD